MDPSLVRKLMANPQGAYGQLLVCIRREVNDN
jgi:hypothetical protein